MTHEPIDDLGGLLPARLNLELIWSENESDDQYDVPVNSMTEHDSPFPFDDTTEGEHASHETSTD
jgi:hypothetical protein